MLIRKNKSSQKIYFFNSNYVCIFIQISRKHADKIVFGNIVDDRKYRILR